MQTSENATFLGFCYFIVIIYCRSRDLPSGHDQPNSLCSHCKLFGMIGKIVPYLFF